MVEPIVVPRSEHTISRRQIDPDALKVLYRLKEAGFLAYLVGGSVRDLLLGLRPKDFDVSTSAHPYQVKRLFRNCWIIGRRFRLAHVRFGPKVVEVATFRRRDPSLTAEHEAPAADAGPAPGRHEHPGDLLIHRDNTFGTAEEDAFRRDFSVNALFYDIATFSIIDYVGGLGDLKARLVRSIGDPEVRFREDPVRMLRAIALASRLSFAIDPLVEQAIRRHSGDMARAATARLLEEYYKILRAGASLPTFRRLREVGLLEPMTPELHHCDGDRLWASLEALDRYRHRFDRTPESLTNAILLGCLLVPLGFGAERDVAAAGEQGQGPQPTLGALPIARRDRERLRKILALQYRLARPNPSPRTVRTTLTRGSFREALTWMEIHGGDPDAVARWRAFADEMRPAQPDSGGPAEPAGRPFRRRRRRRRGRRRPAPG